MCYLFKKIDTVFMRASLLPIAILIYACSAEVNYSPPPDSKEMTITHYSFGKIIIDGTTYECDIMILPDQAVNTFRTKVGHAIQLVDIRDLINDSTQTLIIGIGANKRCSLSNDIADFLKSKGVDLIVLDTYEAVRAFNKLPKTGLSACFHLNC